MKPQSFNYIVSNWYRWINDVTPSIHEYKATLFFMPNFYYWITTLAQNRMHVHGAKPGAQPGVCKIKVKMEV
jgi:hypothetical protein